MKNNKFKIIGALLTLVVLLASVLGVIILNSKDKDNPEIIDNQKTTISIVSPSGAPSIAVAAIADYKNVDVSYEIVSGGDVLSSEFLAGNKDIIIAPINLGVNLISKGAKYQLLGGLSWGNLYVVGNRGQYDGNLAAFGENAVAGKVLELTKDVMAEKDITIDYYGAVSEVAPLLMQGEYGAGLLAEPVMSKVLANNDDFMVLYDIQMLYQEVTGHDNYPQAAIFVSSQAISEKTEAVLDLCGVIDISIEALNQNPSKLTELSEAIDFKEFGFDDINTIIPSFDKLALDFVYATDRLEDIKFFLDTINIPFDDTMYVR